MVKSSSAFHYLQEEEEKNVQHKTFLLSDDNMGEDMEVVGKDKENKNRDCFLPEFDQVTLG